jgi:putative peptidoglycan lipid II flippase
MGPSAWWFAAGAARRVAAVGGLVLLGSAAYFGALWLLGFRPRDFSRRAA